MTPDLRYRVVILDIKGDPYEVWAHELLTLEDAERSAESLSILRPNTKSRIQYREMPTWKDIDG